METVADFTAQTVAVDSPAGRRLLRRIAKGEKNWRDGWRFCAHASTGWRLSFVRTIAGATGEPDRTVDVETDATISVDMMRISDRRPFDDGETVTVPAARYVAGGGATARTVARFLADGWRLAIEHSAGSTASSRHGLAFVRFVAYRDGYTVSATIDETVAVNGSTVCRGSVSVDGI